MGIECDVMLITVLQAELFDIIKFDILIYVHHINITGTLSSDDENYQLI
jgi:hypothetical protein